MYDVVIPLKVGEQNEDLRFTLRSLDMFGGEIGSVWLVGYKPSWVQNVRVIRTVQDGDKWLNTFKNRIAACHHPEVSARFLLFNDDFILTAPVEDWDYFTNVYCGTLLEKAEELKNDGRERSRWQKGFRFTDEILKRFYRIRDGRNFEFHAPMLIDKKLFLKTYRDERLMQIIAPGVSPCVLHRSLHANLYRRPDWDEARCIEDNKLRKDIQTEDECLKNGWFSVKDGMIGWRGLAPRLNAWLEKVFPEKSRFEV